MDTSSHISTLVETYKELNTKYRPLGESPEVLKIVTRMRDDEIKFSKAVKDRITGIGTYSEDSNNSSDIVEGAGESLAQVISQFGSARATTLNLLKGIEDNSVWQNTLDDGSTILQRVEEMVQSDTNQLKRLTEITSI